MGSRRGKKSKHQVSGGKATRGTRRPECPNAPASSAGSLPCSGASGVGGALTLDPETERTLGSAAPAQVDSLLLTTWPQPRPTLSPPLLTGPRHMLSYSGPGPSLVPFPVVPWTGKLSYSGQLGPAGPEQQLLSFPGFSKGPGPRAPLNSAPTLPVMGLPTRGQGDGGVF